MAKMRVFEYAKRRSMSTKELVTVLAITGHPGKTNFSGLNETEIADLNRYFARKIRLGDQADEVIAVEAAVSRQRSNTRRKLPPEIEKVEEVPKEPKKTPKVNKVKEEPVKRRPTIRIIRREDIQRQEEEQVEQQVEEQVVETIAVETQPIASSETATDTSEVVAAEVVVQTPEDVEVSVESTTAVEVASTSTEETVVVAEKTTEVVTEVTPEVIAVPVEVPAKLDEEVKEVVQVEKTKVVAKKPEETKKTPPVKDNKDEKSDVKPAGTKKVFIRPPQPIMPVQPIGKAKGMNTEKRPQEYSMEDMEKILLGRTSIFKPGEEKPADPNTPGYMRPRQYSASGQRLDVGGFGTTGRSRRKKTSRKEKKAALKARQKQEDFRSTEAERAYEEKEIKEGRLIKLDDAVTVGELCDMIDVKRTEIISKLMGLGIMNLNQKIDIDVATLIAEEYGFEVKTSLNESEDEILVETVEDNPVFITERPPIVTVMGHVDHGKTSLLDAIRKTNVADGEAGGITQHIGAYQVMLDNGRKVTFLDTPGHEAFTAMRAHGAAITDIAILVVAADDGVQPQTIEAIDHATAAEVPIIVAINKIDRVESNVDNVKQELAKLGLTPEDWGGETICVEVSAKKEKNINTLIEMVLLVAEMRELKAEVNRKAVGVVIEAQLDKGRGPVATVLIQTGTLKIADPLVINGCYGKVRTMINDKNKRIKTAGPSTPVEIVGLSSVPQVGAALHVTNSEKTARVLAEKYDAQQRTKQVASKRISLTDLFDVISRGEIKDLNLIVKGDVTGSVGALKDSLEKLSTDKVRVNVISTGVGQISENDVMLASASNAFIIGFHVRPSSSAEKLAITEKIEINVYRVIYDCINDIKLAMDGLLDPTYREIVMGRVEVREIYKIPKIGVIAGCFVTEGKVVRNKPVRLIRDGVELYEGKISSLKRFKDDASEVKAGYECGLGIENYNDLKSGDLIEVVDMELIKPGDVGATA